MASKKTEIDPFAEAKFLEDLEKRARVQKNLVGTEILPEWAVSVGEWLVVNPWRLLAPLACMLYIVLRFVYGEGWREIVLAIFGGF